MARIRKSTSNGPSALGATVASGLLSVMIGPAAFLFWPAFFAASKKDYADEIDEIAEDDSRRIIDTAERTGNRSVEVKQTIGSGGIIFNFPVTRTYTAEFDHNLPSIKSDPVDDFIYRTYKLPKPFKTNF
ncbi:hypothetical protein C4546_02630 [Candidatus Parcubacteria bacterium]|jgi:hypothetical protein|nr:MAG: hypothetical protein C4546_02630 [Candidatus Parcubacteria bacterium]